MVKSSSLDRSTLEDFIEIYFIFFRVLFHLLGIFEVYLIFWKYKRK
jgi:hypothetical protein